MEVYLQVQGGFLASAARSSCKCREVFMQVTTTCGSGAAETHSRLTAAPCVYAAPHDAAARFINFFFLQASVVSKPSSELGGQPVALRPF